jgi:hypothetical protein
MAKHLAPSDASLSAEARMLNQFGATLLQGASDDIRLSQYRD